ncbi:hypothetical protein V2J09_000167 [Rumex salicifolius]
MTPKWRVRFRQFGRSTKSLQYSVYYAECWRVSRRYKPGMCGSFLSYKLEGNKNNNKHIGCLASTGRGRDENYYYSQHHRAFTTKLLRKYRNISREDANKVADDFVRILQIANAGHVCSRPGPGTARYNTEHDVVIEISPSEPRPESDVIIPKDMVGSPRAALPATTASIVDLSKAEDGKDGTCAVCLEGMGRWMKMKMPCKHSFHATCIIKWLLESHSCPMCRHQLPAARFKQFY